MFHFCFILCELSAVHLVAGEMWMWGGVDVGGVDMGGVWCVGV